MATIQYSGWLFKDDGTAVDGATVALFEQGSTTAVGSSVTTGDSSWADGYWEITTTQEPDSTGSYYAHDVKITSGSSVRWLRGKTRQSFAEVDIRNATGATQGGLLVANNANTASNKVATFANRMRTGVDGDEIYLSFEMMNDADEIHEFARITAEAVDSANGNEDGQIRFGIADGDKSGDAGGIVDVLTLNTTTGGVTSVITDTISQYNNTVTVGVDDTGYDVKFFGASAGAYMLWDESADQLVIMGKSADAVDSTGKLLLATSLTNVNANDVLGKIEFQAPHETGTDATAIAAAIEAVAQGTFAAAVNATDLIFKTGHSEAATEKFRITSQGELGIGGATYGSSGDVLTSGGAGAAPTWETPTTGDITGVSLTGDTGGALSVASGSAGFTLTGGTGIDTSGSGTTVTFALDLSELTDTAIANGDYIVFTDTTDSNATVKGDLADVATLFAGTGLTASSSVIGVDASQAITALTGGDLTIYEDANNADVSLKMGTSATESLTIQVLNGGSNKTAEAVHFSTATASGTADHGSMVFDVDGTDIVTIDDGGLNIGTGSLETATIDYTDGDLSMTIADGGKVTFAAGFAVGSDAAGDILYSDGTNYVRLARGSDDEVLTLASGVPSWAAASGGGDTVAANVPSDGAVSGITATFTAGEALERGEVVYFKQADSKMWKAVATAEATSRCVAMAAADISADASGTFLMMGFCTDNSTFPDYSASSGVGKPVYTPEAETSSQNVPEKTPPDSDGDFVQVIGFVHSANTLYFNPSQDIIEHA